MNSPVDDEFVNLPVGFVEQLGEATSLFELLEATARWLQSVVAVNRASITLANDDGKSLELYAIGDRTIIPDRTQFGLDDSLVGLGYSTQRLINLPDLSRAWYRDAQKLSALGLRSALVVPLVSAGRAFGTINVGRFEEGYFSKHDELVLRSVASMLASYIWVHRQIEREYRAARIDELTGLLNRRAILEVLREKVETSAESPPSVLFLDLDGFKGINDAHGHAAGDALLVEVARRLCTAVRSGDIVGRLGGDEFLAICPTGRGGESVEAVARRLVKECGRPVVVGNVRLTPRISVGITTPRSANQTTEELLAEADHAMYEAKRSDGSVSVVNERIRAHADLVASVDRDLEAAIESGEMDFHYQPIKSLVRDEVMGAEALLRWHHPELGLIPPPLLLERIEATGQIEAFTKWSLNRVAGEWSNLQNEIPAYWDKAVAMNLNPSQLGLRPYASWHMEVLEQHGMRPTDMVVEVVESGKIEVDAQSERTLRTLGEAGVIIGLDDFGTGYNALAYFTRFPIHAVKFDRSLTQAMVDNANVRTIVNGLVNITSELGITPLAEGVETQAEVDVALAMGMDHAQGYFIGMPVPMSEFRLRALERSIGGEPALARSEECDAPVGESV